jgi:fucose 4-O-acetylase-like acetyltransferase
MSKLSEAAKHTEWIYAGQGLAIVLIVFGHVLGGVLGRGWLANEFAGQAYKFIYLFHVQLYFVLAGLLCMRCLQEGRLKAFISVTGSVLWVYVLWTFLIGTALLPVIGTFMSGPPDTRWSVKLVQAVTGELSWFIWTLYVVQVILILLSGLPAWLLLIVSIVASLALPDLQLGTLNRVIDYLPFLFFGAMLWSLQSRLQVAGSWWLLPLSLVGFGMLAVALSFQWTEYKPVWIACGMVGALAAICLALCLSGVVTGRVVANLGLASLAIFVLHPYFQGAAREVVLRLIGPSPVWQLVLPTVVGVAGPFVMWALAQYFGVPWLFRLQLSKIDDASARLA